MFNRLKKLGGDALETAAAAAKGVTESVSAAANSAANAVSSPISISGGKNAMIKQLEDRIFEAEEEIQEKDLKLTKSEDAIKKLEQQKMKILTQQQAAESELNKFRQQRASANDAVSSRVRELEKTLEDKQRALTKLEANSLIMGKDLAESKASEESAVAAAKHSADQAGRAEKQLSEMNETCGPEAVRQLEERLMSKIGSLKKQLDVSQRRLQNAKYVSEANEALAAEAQLRQITAEASSRDSQRKLARAKDKLDSKEHQALLDSLETGAVKTRGDIQRCEGQLRACQADPLLSTPGNAAGRRKSNKLRQRLLELREAQSSRVALLQEVQGVQRVQDELRSAACSGDIKRVAELLERGLLPNATDKLGYSALHYAAGNGSLASVRLLLGAGADINEENGNMTPLILAARGAHADVVQFLLDEGAEAEGTNADGRTAVHVACEKGNGAVIEVLLNNGANLQSRDKEGATPLHIIAETNNAAICAKLLERGAKDGAKDAMGRTPIEVAREKFSQKIIASIKEHNGAEDGVIQPEELLMSTGASLTPSFGNGLKYQRGRQSGGGLMVGSNSLGVL